MQGGKGRTLWQEKLGLWGESYLGLSPGILEITTLQDDSFGREGTILTWLCVFKKYFVNGDFYLLLVALWWGCG